MEIRKDRLPRCAARHQAALAARDEAFAYLLSLGFSPEGNTAVYQSLAGGPALGFPREPGQTAAPAAAAALKELLDGKLPFRLAVYPPEEEPPVDLALASGDTAGGNCRVYEVTFTGRQAHAAAHPQDGRSAFDGLQLAFHALARLRAPAGADLRCTLTDNGGTPANVVPDLAKAEVLIRTETAADLEAAGHRLTAVLEGAALATGTTAACALRREHLSWVPRLRVHLTGGSAGPLALMGYDLIAEPALLASLGIPR